jgi:sec-independent protein translocase protein TatA
LCYNPSENLGGQKNAQMYRKESTMFGLRPEHIVIIVVVALLIFGPKQLPELGKSLGKAINEFRNAGKEATDAMKQETDKSSEQKKEEQPKAG